MELSEAMTAHGVPVLQISGEVDLGTAAALRSATEGLLARHTDLLIVDLSDVTFLDSAGLKVLDDLQQQAAGANRRVALVCPHERVRRLLQITGLDESFSLHDTREDAAASEGDGV